jgi:hypothetical protein
MFSTKTAKKVDFLSVVEVLQKKQSFPNAKKEVFLRRLKFSFLAIEIHPPKNKENGVG